MKKEMKETEPRRVLARVLAENLYDVQGSATWTSLNGPAPDTPETLSSDLSEAATSESIPDR